MTNQQGGAYMSKLVVYFSFSGVTAKKAKKLAKKNSADIFELKAKIPYTKADVNWRDKKSRNVLEYNDETSRPEIEEMPDLADVDEIWIGYPIWWYTHPRIINTFFDRADLTGKKIHLFATSSVTGIEGSIKDLKESYPDADIVDGKRL